MKIVKTSENEYCWKSVFKYRKSTNDFIIERKSSRNKGNNHEVYLEFEEARQFVKFFRDRNKQ